MDEARWRWVHGLVIPNYKDLLTSVKFHVVGSSIVFSSLSYKIIFIVGMALLKAISLEMLHRCFPKSCRAPANLLLLFNLEKDVLYTQ